MTSDEFNAIFAKMQETNERLIKTLLEQHALGGKTSQIKVDSRGIGKPEKFDGKEEMYPEWSTKFMSYVQVMFPESVPWTTWAMASKEAVGDDDIELQYDENKEAVKSFAITLYSLLISSTSGDAWRIVESAGTGNGLEALRLIVRRFDPKSPGAKRSILKNLLTVPSCKKIVELEKTILHVENLIKKYENMSGKDEKLPNDLVATILINVCHKELRDYLELQTKEMSRIEVRSEIFNYIERKRGRMTEAMAGMEMDSFEESCWPCGGDRDRWQFGGDRDQYQHVHGDCGHEENLEELNYFGGKGWGKAGKGQGGKGKGFGYGGFGGKSYGKGSWSKGGGKGWSAKGGKEGGKAVEAKGGGKGKGGVVCYWCGLEGHVQAVCPEKDKYMENVRAQRSDPRQLHECSLEGTSAKQGQSQEIANLENQAKHENNYRYLGSFVGRNRFQCFQRDADDVYEEEFPEAPPGLNNQPRMTKMPKWTKSEKKVKFKELSMLKKKSQIEVENEKFDKELLEFKKANQDNGEYIEGTVDSGASDSVGDEDIAPDCEIVPSEASLEGVKYVSASGDVIENVGEKHILVETRAGHLRNLNLQMAKGVTRVLLSVSKICDAGNEVRFMRNGGYILNLETGEKDYFERKDGVYRMRLKIVGNGSKASGFPRPGR